MGLMTMTGRCGRMMGIGTWMTGSGHGRMTWLMGTRSSQSRWPWSWHADNERADDRANMRRSFIIAPYG